MQPILQELQWRGLIHQSTEPKELAQQLEKPTVVYAGFDPTADSLHVGSLLPLMMLRRFQQAGHRPVALVGGATGMIGDPSGKTDERQLLSKETLQANVDGIRRQLGHFLDFTGPSAAILVNNFDWMHGFSFLDFLRDVGKNFPINVMLTKDSVKSRLERTDSGLSYTEFSYMLLQAYDFVYLAKHHDCLLQIGGSDQWGNITAGIDLGRRMLSRSLHGLTCPLLTTSDGKKMGKTEKGAVWLAGERTSPFEFYQYFINVADADVLMTLRFLSDVSEEEYRDLEVQIKDKPQERAAQTRLAESLTRLVHGQSKLDAVQHATKLLFGADITQLTQDQLNTIFEDVPSQEMPRSRLADGLGIIDALCTAGLANSKSEARRTVTEGAAYLNNQKVTAFDRILTESDLAGKYLILRAGKKRYGLLRFV
ncbi:MAG: tyrosine--tRNA ligase [Planctomycetaceae bacterium]|jgi:tyrosyl-tRNA synthetase|nr:tyrosine--tRNA ligase [Planctomycetaceae bacterium]